MEGRTEGINRGGAPEFEGESGKNPNFLRVVKNTPPDIETRYQAEKLAEEDAEEAKKARPETKERRNWKAMVLVGLALAVPAAKGAEAAYHEVFPTDEEKLSNAKTHLNIANMTDGQKEDAIKIDDAIYASNYAERNDAVELYSLVESYQTDSNAQEDEADATQKIQGLIDSGQATQEAGFEEIVAPIHEKLQKAERGELGYPFTPEEAEKRIIGIGSLLGSNLSSEYKAKIAHMYTTSENFSVRLYENPDLR